MRDLVFAMNMPENFVLGVIKIFTNTLNGGIEIKVM